MSIKPFFFLILLQIASNAQDIEAQKLIRDVQLKAAGGIYYGARSSHADIASSAKRSLVVFHHSPFNVMSIVWIREVDNDLQVVAFAPSKKDPWMASKCKADSELGGLAVGLINYSGNTISPRKDGEIMNINKNENIKDPAIIECYLMRGKDTPKEARIQCGYDNEGEIQKYYIESADRIMALLQK